MARIKHGTLVANTVATVSIAGDSGTAEIVIVAAPATIYFRCDGVNPTIAGDDCEVIVAGLGAGAVVDLPANFSIRLISAGTPAYSVKGM